MYAQDDADEQASQVSDMTEEGISAMVIAPVDPYGLSEELKAAKEAEIPVIAYDDLIMIYGCVKILCDIWRTSDRTAYRTGNY